MTKPRLLAISCCLVALWGCKTPTATNFSQSYRNPGYEETAFEKLMVVGVAHDQETRRAFESALASAIGDRGA